MIFSYLPRNLCLVAFPVLVLSSTLLGMTACSPTKPPANIAPAPAKIPAQDIQLFTAKPLSGWNLVVSDAESQVTLTGEAVTVPKSAQSRVPNSQVSATLVDKDGAKDAIHLKWKDAWGAVVSIEGGTPLNVAAYVPKGVLSFDINVQDLSQAGLAFKVTCGKDCERKLPYLFAGRALQGKGWQHLAFPLSCFLREDDDLSQITRPFVLESGASGELSIANIRYEMAGTANATCPDFKTASVTPDMLNEHWSLSWWRPRHEQKLQQIKDNPQVDLVFIGDSITHGWEREGFNVWQKYYAKRNALDLGFSGDRTENILWRLQHGEVDGIHPKVAVLMFGTNNTGQRLEDPKTTILGIKRNLDELQQRLPDTKLLLLAIFPRDEQPDAQMRRMNEQVNQAIAHFADDKKIFFLDINKHFLDEKGVLHKEIMPDLLHPNEHGYEIWAEAMEPTLKRLMSGH